MIEFTILLTGIIALPLIILLVTGAKDWKQQARRAKGELNTDEIDALVDILNAVSKDACKLSKTVGVGSSSIKILIRSNGMHRGITDCNVLSDDTISIEFYGFTYYLDRFYNQLVWRYRDEVYVFKLKHDE